MAHHQSTHSHRGRGRNRSRNESQNDFPYERQSYERHPQDLRPGNDSGWEDYYSDQQPQQYRGQNDYNQRGFSQRDYDHRDYDQRGYDQRDYSQRDLDQRDYNQRLLSQRDFGQRDYNQRDFNRQDWQRGSRNYPGQYSDYGSLTTPQRFDESDYASGSTWEDYGGRGSQRPQDWQGSQGRPDFGSIGGRSSGGYGSDSRQNQTSFRGRAPKDYARSDERIREDICECLTQDHLIDASEISVNVKSGVVILEGSVDDRSQKFRAEDLADHCSGVQDVQNHLILKRSSNQVSSGSQSSSKKSQGQGESERDKGEHSRNFTKQ